MVKSSKKFMWLNYAPCAALFVLIILNESIGIPSTTMILIAVIVALISVIMGFIVRELNNKDKE